MSTNPPRMQVDCRQLQWCCYNHGGACCVLLARYCYGGNVQQLPGIANQFADEFGAGCDRYNNTDACVAQRGCRTCTKFEAYDNCCPGTGAHGGGPTGGGGGNVPTSYPSPTLGGMSPSPTALAVGAAGIGLLGVAMLRMLRK